MQHNSSDIIVIGGGPCGSFTALNLAKLGCNVKIFEEHNEIGFPCHCAGHLSLMGLKSLGLYPLPPDIVENTYRGAIFHSPRGNNFSVRCPSPVTCSVNRVLLDKYIAELAKDAGAEYFLDSRVESLITEGGSVEGVVVKRERGKEKFPAKLVVDAEGVSSRIVRQTGLSPSGSRMLLKTVETEAEDVKDTEKDTVEIFLGKGYAPGFYAWLMPKHDGRAKVGLAAESGNPWRLLKRLMLRHPAASKKLRKAKILHRSFHSLPLGGPIPKAFSDGFLVVGDAASQVKPTTGGGVIFGMTCGKIAAEIAYEALHKDEYSSDFLQTYQSRYEEKLGTEIRFMLRIRKMLDTLPDDKLDDIVALCTRIGLERALRNMTEIDFQRSILLRTLWNPRIFLTVSYFLFSYLMQSI